MKISNVSNLYHFLGDNSHEDARIFVECPDDGFAFSITPCRLRSPRGS